ncbi:MULTISPECIES: hypothetical protein [Streptomycetaceae]|uniref:Putative membrane protein n=1 Tax=Streptantibioticus cattleyicolor (strain ATCC 35852 / DSM 46488 / JCM 4925 / NBRC 14057 / NRRL 8057) TaxID=1003195 RepID=F8JRL1_STREN|nr:MULTISPECIES: hypothetical protein [Streptomycetaceae]AEW97897.1 putative membrane protein [Streptantibioticus cattleyicolor NRRL 8057 = DSM 46488]MYS62306.1 hypothetical protein [Streptomyces sp. SID5468]CCB78212.1 putative membrane protein [Streptantibioticus cattleyicolor NRRL 8057 = DSM 46488]
MFPEPASRTPRDAERSASHPGLSAPPTLEEQQEQARTLLRTAATQRPVAEVAALVSLLKQTGGVPDPAEEALHAAALARPVEEVTELVALLNRPPHDPEVATAALRAAALARPIDEVNALVVALNRPPHDPSVADDALRAAATGRPVEELVQLVRLLGHRVDEQDALPPEPPAGHDVYPADDHHGGGWADEPAATTAFALPDPGYEPAMEPEPVTDVYPAEPAMVSEHRELFAPLPPIPAYAGPLSAVDPAATGGGRGLDAMARGALRWPAAAALAVCGLIHLPPGFPQLRADGFADVVSLAVTALCLVLAVCLAGRDTARLWLAGAAAGLAVIVLHALAGVPALAGLGLDAIGTAAGLAAGTFALLAVVLSAAALLWRPRAERDAAPGA